MPTESKSARQTMSDSGSVRKARRDGFPTPLPEKSGIPAYTPLKGFGGAGVLEIVEDDAGGTCRAVYTVKFAESVFVLHCFQKKSKSGIATPKEDMYIIRARLKVAEALAKELRHGKEHD